MTGRKIQSRSVASKPSRTKSATRHGRGSSTPKPAKKKVKRHVRQDPSRQTTTVGPAVNYNRHIISNTKAEIEAFRRHVVQYMDANGYVSWSAKKRRYVILGACEVEGGLVTCPNCKIGQLMVIKSQKSGKRFMGCSNFYGGCDSSSPLLQKARLRATKKACKECGWPEVIFRYATKQKWTRQCSNIRCATRNYAHKEG